MSAERLLDGRHAGQPGWTVDRFGAVALIQCFDRDGADPDVLRALVADAMAHPVVGGVVLKERSVRDRERGEGALVAGELPAGAPDDPFSDRPGRLVVDEDDMRLGVDLLYGFNVGLFLDARPMRQLVRARSEGARVLNLFSYTASFGVAAARGGARSTTNVDLVPSALERGKANYTLNGLAVDPRSHVKSDVFEFLKRARKRGTTWEIVVCDPPPVPTTGGKGGKRRKNFDPARDMEKLLRLCLSCVSPGGALLALSAARGAERFEDPLAAAMSELPCAPSVQWIPRAQDFPGTPNEGLRAAWITVHTGANISLLP